MIVDLTSRCISTASPMAMIGLEHDVQHHVLERHHQGVPEQLVAGDLDVVVEPDEVRRAEQVVTGQAEVEAADGRVEVEDQEADGGRRDEQQRHAQLAPAAAGLALLHVDLLRAGRGDGPDRHLDGFGGHRLTHLPERSPAADRLGPSGGRSEHGVRAALRTSSSVLSTLGGCCSGSKQAGEARRYASRHMWQPSGQIWCRNLYLGWASALSSRVDRGDRPFGRGGIATPQGGAPKAGTALHTT